jgi:hypothetical protein
MWRWLRRHRNTLIVVLSVLGVITGLAREIAARQDLMVPGLTAPLPAPSGPIASGPAGLVTGPTFGPKDDVAIIRLAALDIQFRVPSNWECVGSPKSFGAAAYCFDDSRNSHAGAWITERSCATQCGAADLTAPEPSALNNSSAIWPGPSEWQQSDATTWHVERRYTNQNGERIYGEQMTHFWRGGTSQLIVQAAGPAGSARILQAIVNDMRKAAAP